MPKQMEAKKCFVIAPIGEEGTEIRRRSNQVLQHIIRPAAEDCHYTLVVRADEISEPGMITSQVIQHLLEDDLVIADLTGRNANVFYELAIRHVVRKPVVQIIQEGEPIPFDVAQSRTIHVDHRDLDSAARCRDELTKQIRAVEKDPSSVDTPISIAVDLQFLRQSDNPLEKSSAEIIFMLQELRSTMMESMERERRPRIHPKMLHETAMYLERLISVLNLPDDEQPDRARFEDARQMVYRLVRMYEMMAVEGGLPLEMVHDLKRALHRAQRG